MKDEKIVIVYKVCRIEGEKIKSMVMEETTSIKDTASITYVVDKWIEAPQWLRDNGYHITAFDSLPSAEKFITSLYSVVPSQYKIYECYALGYIGKESLPKYCYPYSVMQGKLKVSPAVHWPQGTVMVKKIKLVKEVLST